jgi:hypothetical protein
LDPYILASEDLTEINLACIVADPAAMRDRDRVVVKGILELG